MGNLNYVKIWHDNSGEGEMASWYLKHIIVHDLQTREKFYFLCENWLAVEMSDGKLERELFVACQPQKTELKYFLRKEAKENINDAHIWLSLFKRPLQSSFTRLDRVTCCFVFLYISSLLNIFYYNKPIIGLLSQYKLYTITLEQV